MFTSYVSQQCYALPHGENRRTLYWRLSTDISLKKKRTEKKENGCTCHLYTPSLQKEEVDVWRFCFRNRDHSFLTKFFTGGLKMLVLFFRQDGILSVISLG